MAKYYRKHKRVKYNWLHIINELVMVKAYEEYKANKLLKLHLNHQKEISENRFARAFCLHFRGILPHDLSWAIKGKEAAYPGLKYVHKS